MIKHTDTPPRRTGRQRGGAHTSTTRTLGSSKSTSRRPVREEPDPGRGRLELDESAGRRDPARGRRPRGLRRCCGVGHRPGHDIVLYGDKTTGSRLGLLAAQAVRHRNVRILNGGRKYWLDNGLPLSVDDGHTRRPTSGCPSSIFCLRAFRDDILPRLATGARPRRRRSPAEYKGEIIAPPGMTETAQRAGHIRARNDPWAQTVREDGTFKTAEDLASCTTPRASRPTRRDRLLPDRERSSHSWFVLRYLLGYDQVRNYDGSWTEYGSLIGVPIEKPAPGLCGVDWSGAVLKLASGSAPWWRARSRQTHRRSSEISAP